MSAIRSIELAIELAVRRRDEAAGQLAAKQRAQFNAQGQLKQLVDYVEETDSRLVRNAGRAVSLEVLRHHYQFMSRLQDAIRMQGDVVKGSERQIAMARSELAKAESAVMGLRKVLQKRLSERQRILDRREQSANDELATQLHIRNMSGSSQGAQRWQ